MTNHEPLCERLRALDPSAMSTAEVVTACRAAVPEAAIPEIAAALRQVGAEREEEAETLEQYNRCQQAGIRGVVAGGKGGE